jgi:DNA-binding winged helix-turn-helix (wHTH) protein
VERISASATRIDASADESGGVGTNSYLGAVALALANQEVRQQLQLIIQAYDLLATGRGTAVAGSAACAGGRVFSFGPFRLLPSQRLLLEDDRRIHIGSRAFDILTTLVERAGEVVGKEELIARVWPNVFVDDSNLKTQVSGVRRALGESRAGGCYIVTVPGRGYNFVAPVSLAGVPALHGSDPKQTSKSGHLHDSMTQRHDVGSVPSLPALIRVLEPSA